MFFGENIFLALFKAHFKISLSRAETSLTPANSNSIVIYNALLLWNEVKIKYNIGQPLTNAGYKHWCNQCNQ